MGLSRVYLDSCIVIYSVEVHPVYGQAVVEAINRSADRLFCISPLVELECLVHPLRNENAILVSRYEQFFLQCECLEIEPACYRMAAELRARRHLKTPDALHLAAARSNECAEIWTNDDRLNSVSDGLAVNLLAGLK